MRKKHHGWLKNNDNDERRKLTEYCIKTNGFIVNPIIDWLDKDVWNFIKYRKIKCNPLYCMQHRIGCIGRPMHRLKGRQKDFALYPKYKKLYLLAFKKMLDVRGTKNWKNEYDCFNWWMEDKNLEGQIKLEEFEDDV